MRALSGVKRTLTPYDRLWYRRTFAAPDLSGKKVAILRDHSGLSAAVHTQLTDVETESNNPLTYDRRGSIWARRLPQWR